jgi:succinyl-CoA synthetase alpha subunit
MSILVNKDTRVIVQGITGKEGTFHSANCLEYGTKIVAGVTPGKGGTSHLGKPVFDTVQEAVRATAAEASLIFVPPGFAADAIMEAVDAGIAIIVCITEGIPVKEIIYAKKYAKANGSVLIGPNCPGIITADECKMGIMPGNIFKKGKVGLISKSGTLTYEAANQIVKSGFGISTAVGIGGDPLIGTDFRDILHLFEQDSETEAIVMIGEIGGDLEIQAAGYIKENITKPVVAFIAGRTAPKGKRMGHAGAIIAGSRGTAQEKIQCLRDANVTVALSPAKIGETLAEVLKKINIL